MNSLEEWRMEMAETHTCVKCGGKGGGVEEEVTLSEWEFAMSAFPIILQFTGRHL